MKRLTIFVILTSLSAAGFLLAEERGTIGQVHRVKPAMGHTLEFEKAYKGHIEWHRQQNDSWNWDCWQYVAGPYTDQYAIVTGGHHWADFARGEMGSADSKHAQENLGPHMEEHTSYFSQVHPDISSATVPGTPPPAVSVYNYILKPGKTTHFLSSVRKMHQALQAGGWKGRYMWVEVAEGSPHNAQFYVVVMRDSWGDFEEPEKSLVQVAEEQMGRSETELAGEQFWDAVQSTVSHTLVYRSDLSYRP